MSILHDFGQGDIAVAPLWGETTDTNTERTVGCMLLVVPCLKQLLGCFSLLQASM